MPYPVLSSFSFHDSPGPELHPPPLHDALPICRLDPFPYGAVGPQAHIAVILVFGGHGVAIVSFAIVVNPAIDRLGPCCGSQQNQRQDNGQGCAQHDVSKLAPFRPRTAACSLTWRQGRPPAGPCAAATPAAPEDGRRKSLPVPGHEPAQPPTGCGPGPLPGGPARWPPLPAVRAPL